MMKVRIAEIKKNNDEIRKKQKEEQERKVQEMRIKNKETQVTSRVRLVQHKDRDLSEKRIRTAQLKQERDLIKEVRKS